jgi:predicted branched-subunit amino acid permease
MRLPHLFDRGMHGPNHPMSHQPTDLLQPSGVETFLAGWRAAWTSVFSLVLIGTYVGIGALAHDYGFGLWWAMLSTVLVWAGPAQVILLSALGAGATPVAAALAVGLSGVRLLPMVVSLLALIKRPDTRARDLVLPAHLTAVSMWVEALRLLPGVPRAQRIAFSNGLGTGFLAAAQVGTLIGFYLAASLPPLLTAGLLFLTPMSFLFSTARNSQLLVDRLALVLGLVVGPLLAYEQVGLDLLWTGVIAGSAAYGVQRLRGALR